MNDQLMALQEELQIRRAESIELKTKVAVQNDLITVYDSKMKDRDHKVGLD